MINSFRHSRSESFDFKGRKVRLSSDYRNVLNLSTALKDCPIYAREELVKYYLVKGKPPKDPQFIHELINYFFPPQNSDGERVIDFDSDMGYIKAAFLQTYGIDLDDGLPWHKFLDLLNALPDDCLISKIIQIRSKPIPPPTKDNAKQRAKLIELKHKFAIKKTDDEIQEGLQKDLKNLVNTLTGAKHG